MRENKGLAGGSILCYGDSNTYGYDPRSCLGGRYPASVRWTGLLHAAGWAVVNAGENGRAIPRLAWEVEDAAGLLRRAGARALVVMLGTNDLLQRPGLAAERCAERMEAFLTALPGVAFAVLPVLLIAPPPLAAGPWTADDGLLRESCRLAEGYRTLAEKLGVRFADAGAWGIELAFDGVHFSQNGHQAFGENIGRELEALLGPSLQA